VLLCDATQLRQEIAALECPICGRPVEKGALCWQCDRVATAIKTMSPNERANLNRECQSTPDGIMARILGGMEIA